MSLTALDLASPIAKYAERLHAFVGDEHHVASPLGAWVLLALAGPALRGDERSQLAEVLGADVDAAAATAASLLCTPHPMIAAGAAVWNERRVVTPALAQWLDALPGAVETGAIPTRSEADTWTREHTLGLIERFPGDLPPDLVLLLASALATKVSWQIPFELAPARALGPTSPWTEKLTHVLRTPRRLPDAFIAVTDRAGDVAVHTARAGVRGAHGWHGLLVTSVIAAHDVASIDVIAAAHQVTNTSAHDTARRSLFDLPLGDTARWSIREEEAEVSAHNAEVHHAVLPAWSATSDHDLSAPELGFALAKKGLGSLLPGGHAGYRFDASQSALARFARVGFEAAAVTRFGIEVSRPVTRRGPRRTAELRFGYPFAVVAVAVDTAYDQSTHETLFGPWHGVPVFSAWVAEPDDATE